MKTKLTKPTLVIIAQALTCDAFGPDHAGPRQIEIGTRPAATFIMMYIPELVWC